MGHVIGGLGQKQRVSGLLLPRNDPPSVRLSVAAALSKNGTCHLIPQAGEYQIIIYCVFFSDLSIYFSCDDKLSIRVLLTNHTNISAAGFLL